MIILPQPDWFNNVSKIQEAKRSRCYYNINIHHGLSSLCEKYFRTKFIRDFSSSCSLKL